ncbi:MAG: hypothetical protein JRG80_17375, partial [Deltaproteobacteria bacterium]|nr:hypothetical protein [Deltaproteobacteria bacterium]
MTDNLNGEPSKYCYPSDDRLSRLGMGLFVAFLVAGLIWVAITEEDLTMFRITFLSFLGAPLTYFAWIMLRGAIERRATLVFDDLGFSIVGTGGASRRILWPEVCRLHHVGLSLDHHLCMRIGGSQKPIRIYYTIEDAAAVLEQCVGKAEAVEDSYSLPFAATRPNLLRAMLLPLSLAIPTFAAGIPPLMDGIVSPIIFFSLIGIVILAGFYAKYAQAPSKISVSEAGVVLVRKAEGEEYVRW